MKEIRIAIIGTGMISHRHMNVIANLQKNGQAIKVVAACDIIHYINANTLSRLTQNRVSVKIYTRRLTV